MHRIMLINSKGGCGKSTIATNLSAYYANWGVRVALADTDPQRNSLNWVRQRPDNVSPIIGINAVKDQSYTPDSLDYLIIDTPASVPPDRLPALLEMCDSIIIPVLPSPMDIHAAGYFIYHLLLKHRITEEDKNICLVANRSRCRTNAYKGLLKFMESVNLPMVTTFRESKNYLECAERGTSIFDYGQKKYSIDQTAWHPLIEWLNRVETGNAEQNKTYSNYSA